MFWRSVNLVISILYVLTSRMDCGTTTRRGSPTAHSFLYCVLRQPVQVFVNPRGSEAGGRGAGYPHQPFILIPVMSLRFGRVVWDLEEGWGGFLG